MRPLANVDPRTIEALKGAVENAYQAAERIRAGIRDGTLVPYGPNEADAVEWERDAELIRELLIESGWRA
jgi:hypothetical protein